MLDGDLFPRDGAGLESPVILQNLGGDDKQEGRYYGIVAGLGDGYVEGQVLLVPKVGIHVGFKVRQGIIEGTHVLFRAVEGAQADGFGFQQDPHGDQRIEVKAFNLQHVGYLVYHYGGGMLGKDRSALGKSLYNSVEFKSFQG